MAATLSSSLPFPTTIHLSIPSLNRPFVTSIAPSPLFRRKGLNFCSARKTFSHFPGRSFWTNRVRTWAAEEEEANPVEETPGDGGEGGEGSVDEPTVSVPVSALDTLKMFFQGIKGISDLKVQIIEGIGSVALRKQTTIQATGVASGLAETIQVAGFKLQTLNLSFDDREEVLLS